MKDKEKTKRLGEFLGYKISANARNFIIDKEGYTTRYFSTLSSMFQTMRDDMTEKQIAKFDIDKLLEELSNLEKNFEDKLQQWLGKMADEDPENVWNKLK